LKGLKKELVKEKLKLEKVLEVAEEKLKGYKVKPNSIDKNNRGKNAIVAMIKGKKVQLYERGDNRKYNYVHVNEMHNAIKLVKKEYLENLVKCAQKELTCVNRLLGAIEKNSIENVYGKIGKAKQMLVNPIYISNDLYREKWLNETYNGKYFDDDCVEIYTDKGERVRSKSEKIIADKLHKENIDYRYEYPITMPGWGEIYPDFTILDLENRRNIILEHFGMMDDESYVNNAILKLQQYAAMGYNLGDNLFVTMETSGRPFDSRMLDGIIKQIKS